MTDKETVVTESDNDSIPTHEKDKDIVENVAKNLKNSLPDEMLNLGFPS
ncbi:hypothetical protein SOV_05380 [Sporomusa ovata DSM 2662]|uniref:Uncharacterized protein n=1 Tax=Sporomusa ovata TaxID=2378 RepID=A0A0U1KWB6_9FIRM|nr:hypothetical protein [Sporomusa ovata]EQB28202.1 hypothetical protein SOV_2c11250 [Sporomusa ovata DSM 2662]CQR71740.1 hypothetical protein SpAn4DRAFT_3606 [Sporomusa ovata]